MTKKYSLGLAVLHPVPYQIPFYRALARHPDIDPTVIYLDDITIRGTYIDEFKTKIQFDRELLDGYDHVFLKNYSTRPDSAAIARINPGLFGLLLRRRFDAVLTSGYNHPSAYFALAAAKLAGSKFLLRAETDLSNPSQGVFSKVKRFALPYVLARANAIMYSCKRNQEFFLNYGVPEERLFPVLSSIDNAALAKRCAQLRPQRQRLRAELCIPEDAKVLLFVGRLTARKRVMDLLNAARPWLRERRDVWLVFVGDGALADDLATAAEKDDITDRVILAGFQKDSDVARFLAMADVFILPSVYDPTPKSVNEAMVFGLPTIVSTGVGTANDLVRHEENGLVFSTGDVTALSHNIGRLLVDDALRRRLEQGIRHSIQKWSPEANAEGAAAALRYVCGRC